MTLIDPPKNRFFSLPEVDPFLPKHVPVSAIFPHIMDFSLNVLGQEASRCPKKKNTDHGGIGGFWTTLESREIAPA